MKSLSLSCFCVVLLGTMVLAQSNPVPLINDPLVPASAVPGGRGFTMTVNGTGFVSSSTVNWNGSELVTNFVSSSQLTATVPSANIAGASTASVTVFSPAPGGGTSNVDYFETRQPFIAVGFGQSSLSTGNYPYEVVAVDLNGDGSLDLVAIDELDLAVSVMIGNGDGTFQLPVEYPVGGYPLTLSIGDFNDDGNLDVVVGTESTDGSTADVSILLGNGDGTFQNYRAFAVGLYPNALAPGDFNGDGKLDLAVAIEPVAGVGNPPELGIMLGNGDGTFQNPVYYGPFFAANGVTTGDFNRDNQLDLALAVGTGVDILLGNGDGTFQSGVNYATGESSNSVVTGDFNGDDRLDLAVQCLQTFGGYNGGPSVLLGNGDGTFQNHVDYHANGVEVVAADVNGDGILDLETTAGAVYTLLGKSDGTFEKAYGDFPAAAHTVGIAVGDFSGHGMLDLVTANEGSNTISVLPQVTSVLSQTFINFGKIQVGKSKGIKVNLNNYGTTAFTITGVSVTGTYAADFKQRNNCGSTLSAGASCVITITFKPQTHAIMTAAVTITDSAVPGSEAITLQGFGVK
jgi:hypothetical protein